MSRHIMLDLETMGVGSHAAIIAIGAVAFDPTASEFGEKAIDRFYRIVDLKSSLEWGGEVTASTVEWWICQSPDAKKTTFAGGYPLMDVLNEFRNWYDLNVQEFNNGEPIPVWGNGAGFDNVILRNAYGCISEEAPWPFPLDRCFRTMKELFREVPRPERTDLIAHDAQDDAIYQAQWLQRIYAHVRRLKAA